MKFVFSCLVLLAASHGYADLPADEKAAIQVVLDHWYEGWANNHNPAEIGMEKANAALAVEDYSDDAGWTNAFGRHLIGRSAIEDFLAKVVFPLPGNESMQWIHQQPPEIKFIRPDVASVYTYDWIIRQINPDGSPMGTRKTHCLWVMAKSNGAWKVESHMVMDEEPPQPGGPAPH